MRASAAPALTAVLLMSSVTASTAVPEPTPTPVPGPTSWPVLPRSDAQPCTIVGTEGNDVLVGTLGPDVMCGLGGDDLLQGLDGDDGLEGGDGVDTATWETSPCCIRADLAVGSATGAGTDRLVGIENLTGSPGDDVLRGDAGSNALSGLGGTDLLYGGDGDDVLLGGDGDDYLAGEGGAAAIDGGEGADVCAEGVGASCYPVAPPDPNDTRGILDVRLVATTLGASPSSWRIATFGRASKRRLWDEGYFVVSFDSKGDRGYDFHVVAKATRGRMRALLLREGSRAVAGIVRAGRPTNRSTVIRVPLDRLEIPAERAYYRWSVRTLFTGTGCPSCLDVVPAEGEGAFPQPVPA